MKLLKYILPIVILLILSSCGEQSGGLFYSLEQESAITNGALENDITIGAMERSNDYYFIAAGSFRYKKYDAAATVEWTESSPTGYDSYLCLDMLLVENTIYAVFYAINESDYKVFSTSTATPASGLTWSEPLIFNISTDEDIIGFEQVEDKIFVYTTTGSTSFNIYAADYAGFDPSDTFETIAADLGTGGDFINADYDGTSYWIAAGNKVFKTDGTTSGTDTTITAAIMAASSNLKGDGFGGIVCADTDSDAGVEVYVTSEEGVMLKLIGGAWEVVPSQYTTTELFEPLKEIIHIQIPDEDIDILLAGSESGYYEMEADKTVSEKTFVSPDLKESVTKLTASSQFDSIDLSEQVINGFFFDDISGNIFALGYRAGLWKNSLKTGDYRFWDIE